MNVFSCVEGVGRGEEGLILLELGKGLSNLTDRMTSRILPLLKVKQHVNRSISQFALTYNLSSLLLTITNMSGHLPTNVTVQLLQVTVHNEQRIVQ